VERGRRKEKEGRVLSHKMDKTVLVEVTRTTAHPFYKKVIRKRAKFAAHDEKNECQAGDRVLIAECRPLSKTKHWRVVQILEKVKALPVKETGLSDPTGK
jgi:small subunit ribosomal protein S17